MLGISSRKRLMNKTTGNNVQRWPLGLIFSSSIALLAYRRRSLNKSGVVGAIASGTAIFSAGGWSWGLALIYFFVCCRLVSRAHLLSLPLTPGPPNWGCSVHVNLA